MSEQNPFAVSAVSDDLATERQARKTYGGIGRLTWLGGCFLALFALVQFAFPAPSIFAAVSIPLLIVHFALVMLRLKNLGYSGWWVLTLLVPLLNCIMFAELFVAPEGYADHRTLDLPGKLAVWSLIGGILLGMACLIH